MCRRAPAGLIVAIDAGERLPVGIADDEGGVRFLSYPRRREAALGQGSTLLLPVDDAEHQLQVLADARSTAAPQLLGYASAGSVSIPDSGLGFDKQWLLASLDKILR